MEEFTARVREDLQTGPKTGPAVRFLLNTLRQQGAAPPAPRVSEQVEQQQENTMLNGGGQIHPSTRLSPPPVHQYPQSRFLVLQQYEGVVLSVDSESFWARLVNKTSPEETDVEGEFPLDVVSRPDRGLVEPGAVFYWYIGYHDSPSGQRTRQSVLRFRRFPAVDDEDLSQARREARQMMAALDAAGEDEQLDDQ